MDDRSTRPAAETSRTERFRTRLRDRRQRRAWRRERRKGVVDAYDATNRAESENLRGGFFKTR
ncbi:hypothetical protein OJ997_23480 [Solirubrobacter phytolaccae]|uniref:Uncharacterized protein n=1 Tax=Solirubrobacter phytolaccae TaxID=1404360 RepID=A0A9X3NBF4_9ACTN|nr:hypothetical protein [Solirubrobacter phytolaccae]MDA0183293.1 hypothetical protein [Solirubrobacter phytolaccae]